jgi:magnesium transporter
MPLNDVDVKRRCFSIGLPADLVDFVVYSYTEETFEETQFQSVSDLIYFIENDTDNDKSYWIEVINRSSIHLPNNINRLCEYFDIHPLTIEDITTLAPYMKVDLFNDQGAIYLLLKIISWNGGRVEQQQISFYLKTSQKILITFQEQSTDDKSLFDAIRNRFRRRGSTNEQQSPYTAHSRVKQMNVDYLFYCLFDAIIDRLFQCTIYMKKDFFYI